MRIAVIADIHGNVVALDAVLADIARRGADMTVNLGDIVSGPLYPTETADRLMPLGFPTIRGNHDRQVLAGGLAEMGASDLFAASRLRADQTAWLAGLPATLRLSDAVLLVHGTPSSDLAYFLETIDADGFRPAAPEDIEERAGADPARLILCGHSHLQRMARTRDGRLVVNPGSVGLPAYADDLPYPHKVEAGSPHARYALIDMQARDIAVEFVSVAYAWDKAAAAAEAHGRPDWAKALRTGTMPVLPTGT
ncbi:metallophosphoesterase family protein [Labrys monachus]|uniref:Phosphodiesterase n=1 Tax=Labrys monachus TaxID=217067 RepID=A0ABU0FKS8_9HYPH|nr:metallophosphoesterase family protein [Labrys monachus]MDQ0394724.1 putative phosphodiesterase [Labrys monachus]